MITIFGYRGINDCIWLRRVYYRPRVVALLLLLSKALRDVNRGRDCGISYDMNRLSQDA
jgi:hypothetical protein